MMTAILAQTSKLKVGSAITPIWPHNPVSFALMWLTMYHLAPGRPMMGLGVWFEPLASKVGVKRTKPLQAIREYTEAIRMLFSRKEISYHGDFVNISEIQIDIPNADKGPIDIPIYVGATGPKMHELAGEIGDGVVMNYWVSVDYIREMVGRVKIGAEKSGRKLEDIDRVQLLSCSVSRDRKEALDAARYECAYYLGYEPHIMEASGASQKLLDEIHKITTWPPTEEKQFKAGKLIPEELVQNLCAAGTPEECRKKVREYIDAGCTCPILSALTPDVELLVDTFAKDF